VYIGPQPQPLFTISKPHAWSLAPLSHQQDTSSRRPPPPPWPTPPPTHFAFFLQGSGGKKFHTQTQQSRPTDTSCFSSGDHRTITTASEWPAPSLPGITRFQRGVRSHSGQHHVICHVPLDLVLHLFATPPGSPRNRCAPLEVTHPMGTAEACSLISTWCSIPIDARHTANSMNKGAPHWK
jgi:hypothetical protein